VGDVDFYGNIIKVDKRVLIPRFETEGLVEIALSYLTNTNIDVVDLGTGSGCIPITLKKKLPNINIDAVDISKDALTLAKENAELNNVNINFIEGDMLKPLNKKYDCIISNPPYIPYDEEVMDIVKNNEPNAFENYINLFQSPYQKDGSDFVWYFKEWFGNTLFVAVVSCIISTAFTLMVAYVMSKIKFSFRKTYLNIALIIGLFPGFMSMAAIYFILQALDLTGDGNLWALVLCNSAGAATGFYVAKGFFDVVPNSLMESARLDGATNAQIFWHIILPMSKPILIYQALMSFTGPWMDFIFAKVILGDKPQFWTVSVGLYNSMFGDKPDTTVFSVFAAGCVCVAVPIVTLFMFLQKYYVEGVTAGSVK
jgi:arabinogalactan oligomer/maltooligosaccharide transport system permease protein